MAKTTLLFLDSRERERLTSRLSPLTSRLSPLASHLSPLTSRLSPLTSRLRKLLVPRQRGRRARIQGEVYGKSDTFVSGNR